MGELCQTASAAEHSQYVSLTWPRERNCGQARLAILNGPRSDYGVNNRRSTVPSESGCFPFRHSHEEYQSPPSFPDSLV